MQNQEPILKTEEVLTINNFLETETSEEIEKLILDGLNATPKYISSRFFYDDKGSELFEKITYLPEYYPTSLEKNILSNNASDITAGRKKFNIIELGSGDCSKISLLFDAMPPEQIAHTIYFPVDISHSAIKKSAHILFRKYSRLRVNGILADFLKHLKIPSSDSPNLICFFGSTIGNFDKKTAHNLLLKLSDQMKPGDRLLLGLDMVKNQKILEKAYNDSSGITAEFNKNILNAINNITGCNFNPDNFEHIAFFNKDHSRIEMHLKALQPVTVTDKIGREWKIKKGEMIHTEDSHKFTIDDIMEMSILAGFTIKGLYSDEHQWFSLVSFEK